MKERYIYFDEIPIYVLCVISLLILIYGIYTFYFGG